MITRILVVLNVMLIIVIVSFTMGGGPGNAKADMIDNSKPTVVLPGTYAGEIVRGYDFKVLTMRECTSGGYFLGIGDARSTSCEDVYHVYMGRGSLYYYVGSISADEVREVIHD
jgi:hypothetical protein